MSGSGVPGRRAVEVSAGYFDAVNVGDKAVIVPDVQRQRGIVGIDCERYADITRSVSGIHLFYEIKSEEVLVARGPFESDTAG